MKRIILALVALLPLAAAHAQSFQTMAQSGRDRIVGRFLFGAPRFAVISNGPAVGYPASELAFNLDMGWKHLQALMVVYGNYINTGSSADLAILQGEWNWAKGVYNTTSAGSCGTNGSGVNGNFPALDDVSFNALYFILLGEVTGDAVAYTYAKAALDCGHSTFFDATLGGGGWYNSTKTQKNASNAAYAVAAYKYCLDESAATYCGYATAIETWIEAAILRAGQGPMTAVNARQIAIGGAPAAGGGDQVQETINGTLVSYTAQAGDGEPQVAAGLVAAVAANGTLTAAGVTSAAPGSTQSVWCSCALTVSTTVVLSGGTTTATVSTPNPAAGSYTNPSDNILWGSGVTQMPGQTNGVPVGAAQPNQITTGNSVSYLSYNIALCYLLALLHNNTPGDTHYLALLQQVSTGIRSKEVLANPANVLMNDRDAFVDAFFLFWYAQTSMPLLSGGSGTQLDKNVLQTTASSIWNNAACPNAPYGGDWQGPCEGIWFGLGSTEYDITVSSQAAIILEAAYYASLH